MPFAQCFFGLRFAHPPDVKRSIPYSQVLRLRRICHSDQVHDERIKEIKGFLVKRGFRASFVEQQVERTRNKSREDLVYNQKNPFCQKKMDRIPIILDYHPALLDLHTVFRGLQPQVDISNVLREISLEYPIISSRRTKR